MDSEERDAIVREMWATHYLWEIAERVGMSESGVCRVGRRLGLGRRPRGAHMGRRRTGRLGRPPTGNPERERVVRDLWGKVPQQEIGDRLGISRQEVCRIGRRCLGLPALPRGGQRPWTDAERRVLRDGIRDGLTMSKMAALVGRTTGAVKAEFFRMRARGDLTQQE